MERTELAVRVRRLAGLADDAPVEVVENEEGIGVVWSCESGHRHEHRFSGPLESLSAEDLRRAGIGRRRRSNGWWARLLRFLGFWLGLSGLYAAFSVCPICGQPGCPVGAAGAGLLGGVGAFLLTYARTLWRLLRNRLRNDHRIMNKRKDCS